MRGRFWKSRTFRFWFICYMLVLMLPTLFAIAFYNYTAYALEQKAYEAGQMSIRQVGNVVDERLEEICGIGDTVYTSSNINRIKYISLPFNASKYYELHKRGKYLSNFSVQQDIVKYVYVYYSDMNCLLDAGHVYTQTNRLEKMIRERIGMSPESFTEAVSKLHTNTFEILNHGNSIVYIRTLGTRGVERKPVITLVIVMNTDSIRELLKDTGGNSQGSAYMVLPQGSVFGGYVSGDPTDYAYLSSLYGPGRVAKGDLVVAYADSKVAGFRYVLSVPCASFLKDIARTQLTFIICLAIMLMLGTLAAYALASKNYKPLHILKQAAHIAEKGEDDFSALNHKLTELLDSEDKMHEEIQQLNLIANSQIFHSLLAGDMKDLGTHQMEQLRGTFTGHLFVAAVIDLGDSQKSACFADDAGNRDTLDVLLNKLTSDLCQNVCEYVIRREDDDYVAVFCFADGTDPNDAEFKVQEIAEKLIDRIMQHLHLPAFIYAGDARIGMPGVGDSYANAKRAQEYAQFIVLTDKQVVLYDETMFSTNISWKDYNIVDAERRFINLMLEANYASGEQVLREILAYYSCKDGMSLYVMRCRMFGVMNMMLNVLHEVEPDIDAAFYEETNPVETLLSARTMKELNDSLFRIIERLIGRQENKAADIKDKLSQVEHYVSIRYFDVNLSVQQIADNFNLSLPYLSRMFKKEKGVGLLDYINRFRVKKAKEIMETDEIMTVSDVAAKVGYNSSQTLIRIFKRYEGVTPGCFRNAPDSSTDEKDAL